MAVALMDYTLEELARTSDDEAVRAQFDARNLNALRIIAFICGASTIPGLISGISKPDAWRVVVGAAGVLLAAAVVLLVRRRAEPGPLRSWIRRHTRAAAITYTVVAYLILVTNGMGRSIIAPWAFTMPLMMLGFRMLPAELIILHASLTGSTLAIALVQPPHPNTGGMLFAVMIVNALAFGVEAFASSRSRRNIAGEWSGRRAAARDQLRMREEFRYAREIQLSMLPEGAPALDWLDLAGASLPANEVGGDYYDYFAVDGRLAIVSGDVAGHGLASGIVLASIRSGFTLMRDSLTDPAAVLEKLHTMIADTSRHRTLVTCAVLLLDPRKRHATVASAGHPPILVRRSDGRSERIEAFAAPLGVRLPLSVGRAELDFAPGDVFVLHTDGIYEARNGFDDYYGLGRLQEALEEAKGSAAEIRDAIVADVERFRNGEPQDDDITLVVARVV